MKRVIIRFLWIFYTIIWYLYAFIFGDCKIFPITGGFSGAAKRRNDEVFRNIFKMVNLNEIFYVMKVVGKIHLGISFIFRIVNYHFHPILEFSDLWILRYWRFKNICFLENFANFTTKSKVKIPKIGPNCSLRLQQ